MYWHSTLCQKQSCMSSRRRGVLKGPEQCPAAEADTGFSYSQTGLIVGMVHKQYDVTHSVWAVAPTPDRVGRKVQKAAGGGSLPSAGQASHVRVAAVPDRQHCRVQGVGVAAGHGLAEGGHEGCIAPDEGEGSIGGCDARGLKLCRQGAMAVLEQLGEAG